MGPGPAFSHAFYGNVAILLVALVLAEALVVCLAGVVRTLISRRADDAASPSSASTAGLGQGILRPTRRVLFEAARTGEPSLVVPVMEAIGSADATTSTLGSLAVGRQPESYGGASTVLIATAERADPRRDAVAEWALSTVCDVYAGLIPTLFVSPACGVRLAAIGAAVRRLSGSNVSASEEQGLLSLLREATRSEREQVAEQACRGIGRLRDERSLPWLFHALSSGPYVVKRAAIHALGELGNIRAIERLVNELEKDEEDLRPELLEALERCVIPPLDSWLSSAYSSPAFARVAALRALGTQGSPELAEAVLPLLDDGDKGVRRAAALAIAGIARASAPRSLNSGILEVLIGRFDAEGSQSTRQALLDAVAASRDDRASKLLRDRAGRVPAVLSGKLEAAVDLLDACVPRGERLRDP